MANCVGRVLSRLARKCQIAVGNALQPYNITAAEEPFLMAVLHNEGFTQEELTAYVGVDKAATARTVKSLEEKGFVKRVPNPKDKRQNRVYSTDAGKEVGPFIREELTKINQAITQGLTQREEALVYAYLVALDDDFDPHGQEESHG